MMRIGTTTLSCSKTNGRVSFDARDLENFIRQLASDNPSQSETLLELVDVLSIIEEAVR